LEDTELIERAQSGDTDAYAALVQRYQAVAVRGAYLATGELAEAEDAAQQAFIKAYYALDRLRPGASFRPWLLRIVVNEASNLRKAAQRRVQREARAAEGLPTERAAPAAEEAILAGEEQRAVLTALMGLREEDRLVLGYRYIFDLSEAEMAEALGVARGTVKSRLARALARLRTRFREVYPLVILAPDFAVVLRQGLADLGVHLPRHSGGELANGVLGRLAAGQGGGRQPSWTAPATMLGPLGLAALILVLLTLAGLTLLQQGTRPSPPEAHHAGQTVIIYGGDLAEEERPEVAQLLGADALQPAVEMVTREELVDTLQAVGLPAAPSDEAISSVALTCSEPGQGLRVGTRHITRIPATVYALALLMAMPIEASVLIAAPSTKPVTGEAALVGVLKTASRCQGGREADPVRVHLAYEQLKLLTALAGDAADLSQASAVMLQAAQAVITGQATDEVSVGAALERAATAEGILMSAAQRAAVVAWLRQLGDHDYGPYAQGYQVAWPSTNAVRVTPASGGER
jgi:RNA polymerase sigma factor (sigma-70 family)